MSNLEGRKIRSVEKALPGAQSERRAKENLEKALARRADQNVAEILRNLDQYSFSDKLRILADLVDTTPGDLTKVEFQLLHVLQAEITKYLGLETSIPNLSDWSTLGGNNMGDGAIGSRHTNGGALQDLHDSLYQGQPDSGPNRQGSTLVIPRKTPGSGEIKI